MASSSGPLLRPLLRLLGYARPYLGRIAVVLVFALLYASGLNGRVYLVQPLLDDVVVPSVTLDSLPDLVGGVIDPEAAEAKRRSIEKNVEERIGQIILFALLIILGMPLARLVRDYTTEWIMTRMLVDMQLDLSTKLLNIPLGQHESDRRGELVTRTGFG